MPCFCGAIRERLTTHPLGRPLTKSLPLSWLYCSFVPSRRFSISRADFGHLSQHLNPMATPQDSDKASKIGKRIIVACDGTWQDADSDSKRDYPWWKFWRRERHLTPASNVARLCRCISKEGVDQKGQPVPQIVFYQAGIGTSLMQRLSGGLTGIGISSNIRDSYSFICNNYEEGDEIFLFGFSRGAFTVRVLSTLLKTIGILNASGLAHFFSISQDWKFQNDDRWSLSKTPFVDQPWGSAGNPRPSPKTVVGQDNAYVKKLKELDFLRCDKAPIAIKACGVWDTVGYVDGILRWATETHSGLVRLVCLGHGFCRKELLATTLLSTPTSSPTSSTPFKPWHLTNVVAHSPQPSGLLQSTLPKNSSNAGSAEFIVT